MTSLITGRELLRVTVSGNGKSFNHIGNDGTCNHNWLWGNAPPVDKMDFSQNREIMANVVLTRFTNYEMTQRDTFKANNYDLKPERL